MLQTRVHGRDRVEFMESICTADVAGLADGAAALTVFTNAQGGIVDDLIVTKVQGGNHLYVVSNAGCRDKDIPLMVRKAEEMKRYFIGAHLEKYPAFPGIFLFTRRILHPQKCILGH